jgi:hypothetical protein
MCRKWNGDSKPPKSQIIPKGDPRSKINSHSRSQAKEGIRKELQRIELEETLALEKGLELKVRV